MFLYVTALSLIYFLNLTAIMYSGIITLIWRVLGRAAVSAVTTSDSSLTRTLAHPAPCNKHASTKGTSANKCCWYHDKRTGTKPVAQRTWKWIFICNGTFHKIYNIIKCFYLRSQTKGLICCLIKYKDSVSIMIWIFRISNRKPDCRFSAKSEWISHFFNPVYLLYTRVSVTTTTAVFKPHTVP